MSKHSEILAYINLAHYASIAQLSSELSISESTARRIVAALDRDGLVQRVHGGAAAINNAEDPNTSYGKRRSSHLELKRIIAKSACSIIKDGSTLILLGGSTIAEMCPHISHMNLTVITNSLIVLNSLKNSETVRIIMLGGLFNRDEYEVGGIIANNGLQFIRADYLFMGTSAFDEKSGFVTANPAFELYVSCIQTANTICVLTDSSKYQLGGVNVTAKPQQVHYLFTDAGIPDSAAAQFRKQGINVICVEEKPKSFKHA